MGKIELKIADKKIAHLWPFFESLFDFSQNLVHFYHIIGEYIKGEYELS